MEHALFVESPAQLDDLHPDYTRVYFGEEFCGRRIPTPETFQEVAERCKSHGRRLTLLTPVVTEPELEVLITALQPALKIGGQSPELGLEVVFNDWGVFESYKTTGGFSPVLGTLLVRQKRDPGFRSILYRPEQAALGDDELRHIRGLNTDANRYIREFVREHFSRIELVNAWQGFTIESGMRASLYLPLVPFTSTRYCKWAAAAAGSRNASNYYECAMPCRDRVSRYSSGSCSLYLFGNTQFYVNSRLPEELGTVDRLVFYVFSPFLPIGEE
jgi:hypothetical protein